MKEIKLTKGFVTLVSDEDFERLNKFKWYAFITKNTKYAVRKEKIGGRFISSFMHNRILPYREGFGTDHKDGDGLNNSRENLRYATYVQNMQNRKKRVDAISSKYKGVEFYKGKYWRSRITYNGRRYHLGHFKSEIDAALAYDEAAREYHGEFAKVNFD